MLIDKPLYILYEIWVQGRCISTVKSYDYAIRRFRKFVKELGDVEIRTVRVNERAG